MTKLTLLLKGNSVVVDLFNFVGIDKMIVRARPLKKLCEFDGKPIPEDYKSDCYHDVDESDFACKEKARIMVKIFDYIDTDINKITGFSH